MACVHPSIYNKQTTPVLVWALGCLLYALLFCTNSYATHFPPISQFDPSTYNAGNQNWMLDQGSDAPIFAANNEGLLLYNGVQWEVFSSPNGTILRSVKVVGEKVYTGSFMDFGYWEQQGTGQYFYTSLVSQLKLQLGADEQFWNILSHNNHLYFQSLRQLYVVDKKHQRVKKIAHPKGISQIFKVRNALLYHVNGEGLFKIENGVSIPYNQQEVTANNRIINIFSTDEGIKILTKENGFYELENGQFKKWNIPATNLLNSVDIFSGIQLKNGGFAIGTIAKGLIILDKTGRLQYQINQTNGLSNNTVLSLLEDQANNIWLGLDNGIDCVNLASPFMEYVDKKGILGTVYTSIVFNNKLYVGTNQGLFEKAINDAGDFKLVPKTNGQVWTLFSYDNHLFCGHNNGTFLVQNNQAQLVANTPGTWRVAAIPNQPNKLIQGNYSGFNVLVKKNNTWMFSHAIAGFGGSAQQFVFFKDKLYLNQYTKGLLSLKLDEKLRRVTKSTWVETDLTTGNAGLVLFNNQLHYACRNGIYILNSEKEVFEKEQQLSNYLAENEQVPRKLISDTHNSMWLFTKTGILHFSQQQTKNTSISEIWVDAKLLKPMHGYENIARLALDTFLIGLTNGYVAIDLNRLDKLDHTYEVGISSVKMQVTEQEPNAPKVITDKTTLGKFHYKNNNIHFVYHVPQTLKYQPIKYQYWLEGNQETWSNWTDKPTVTFANLSHGNYQFKVRAKIGKHLTQNTAIYNFKINTPWYYHPLAWLLYLLLFCLVAYLINNWYKKYYSQQQQALLDKNRKEMELLRLKSEQELMQLKNEQLQLEIKSKNKELGATTMNLIKKNEFLIETRELLETGKNKNKATIEKVINTINEELENEETWEFLKKAFENVDKDFFQKITNKHPQLTPNDLKLCTYLRLNLSSKEIAPLLNMSVRSMETKRYRLRKRMELPHDVNLVEYILSI